MFRIALAFCAGAAALHALPLLPPAGAWVVPLLAAALAARRAPALAAGLAGFAWALAFAGQALASAWPCTRDREPASLVGVVAGPPLEREGRVDFDLEVTGASMPAPWPRRLRLSWYEADRSPRPGETWRLSAKLRCPRGFANPGAPDRELSLLREGIDATGYVAGDERPERAAAPARRPIERLRAHVAGAIAAASPPGPSVAVLQGLAVGVRGSIPSALWEAFAVTGIAHLIAISGLHVTGCAIAVLGLLRLAWRSGALAGARWRPGIESVVVVAVTAAYAAVAGASLPALRTLAMVAAFAGLRWLRRSLPVHHAFAAAAAVLVAFDPLALTSAGFWLSFVATAALLAVVTRGVGWRGQAGGFARAQLAITALLAPVLAVSFGRISLVAPVVNAVAVPVFSLVLLPFVLGGTALAALEPAATTGLWRLLANVLDAAWPVLEAIAEWPLASWAPAAQAPVLVAMALCLALAALLLPIAGLRIAAAVALLALGLGAPDRPAAGEFTLTVVDVGQGLAVVIETERHVLVFDTGPRWRGSGAAARVSLLPYLRARGIRTIDRMVVSHEDQDHAGGAALLIGELRVKRTMSAPGSRMAADEACIAGSAWRWDGIAFEVLHPPADFTGGDNDASCALRASGAGGSALLLADPEAAGEEALIERPLAADVVLLPHHGSLSSSSQALVSAAGARIGIASAGFGNRWNMPVPAVVARWRAGGTTVLDTAHEGAIRVQFAARPAPLVVESERRDRRRWWRAPARD